MFYSNEVAKCEGNQKKLYRLISKLTEGDKIMPYPDRENDFQLSEDFSKFFLNKIHKIMDDIDEVVQVEKLENKTDYRRYKTVAKEFSHFRHLGAEDISKLISQSATKSWILDPIPTELLKQCLHILIDPITDIVNSSLQAGEFPDGWKCAVVTPLLKKAGMDLVYKSYRPVSNLNFISKIVEKAALSQYIDHLEAMSMFSPQNSAYKKNHSTETLLVKINSDIMNNMDCQNVTLLVLLDLSAAFDTVSMDILSEIFQFRFNIKGTVLSWFKTYLTDREQRVKINSAISEKYKLKFGVPQGSCAGPVVFLGYLSSLYDIVQQHLPTVGGYADDHQLYIAFKPGNNEKQTDAVKNLEKCITDVRSWMLLHKLKINDTKTEFLIIGTKTQLEKVSISEIKVGNESIKAVTKVRNLGVIFDSNMSMLHHVNQVCKKGYHQLTKIRQIRKYLDQEATVSVIHAFVTSHIDYCNALLYGCPKYIINKLQKLQNCAARVVTGKYKFDHISDLMKHLHWLPVVSRIEYKIALLAYKCLRNQAPEYLSNLIEKYVPNRTLRSSKSNLLKVPKTRTKTLGSRAFTSAAPAVWNSLPDGVKNLENIDRFKTSLKTYLFNRAYA